MIKVITFKNILIEEKEILLFLETERVRIGDSFADKVIIRSNSNPLPFKEAIITEIGLPVQDWLLRMGWKKIGHFYKAK